MLGRRHKPTLTERLAAQDEAITLLFDSGPPMLLAGPDQRLLRSSASLATAIGAAAPPPGITLAELLAPPDRPALRTLLAGEGTEALIHLQATPSTSFRATATRLGDGGTLIRLSPLPPADAHGSAAVAHDAANSLAVALALAEQSGADPAIAASILAARQLLRRLAGAADTAPPSPPTRLSALIERHAPGLAALLAPSIALVIEPGGPDPTVLLPEETAARVLLNLAANARAAMPGGGTLTLRPGETRLFHERALHGMRLPAGRYGVLAVEDDGPGIPPARLARLFTPGTSFTEGGAGLGLAASQALLREAGGAIELESREGHGTTARLYLPLAGGPVAAPVAKPAPAPPSPATTAARLLLVEDEPALRRALALSLGAAGYDVTTAASAEEALIAPAADLLVADLNLPGQDGLSLLTRLRQRQPALKVVILSGAIIPVPTGLDGVTILTKPATTDELIGALRRIHTTTLAPG